MPYYAGDYYQGDYYEGDPFWGAAIAGLGRLGGRLIGRGVSRLKQKIFGSPAAAGIAHTAIARIGQVPIVQRVGGAIAKHPVLTAAGAAGTVGVLGGGAAARVMRPGVAQMGVPMRGFHISKRTGAMVKNRRMRVTNPRALRRAIRRSVGFARLARRVLHFTSPRAPRGRAIFKFKRRKK